MANLATIHSVKRMPLAAACIFGFACLFHQFSLFKIVNFHLCGTMWSHLPFIWPSTTNRPKQKRLLPPPFRWSCIIPTCTHTFFFFNWGLLLYNAAAKSLQLCPTLCDPIDGSPPGSPLLGILQARTLECVGHFLLQCMKVKSESEVTQSCPTLSDPMDCSLPASSVHEIFQARVLEWGAIAFSVN